VPPNGPPPKRPDGELPTSPPPPRRNSDPTKKILDLQAQCYELAFQLQNAKLDLEQARQDLKHERSRQAEAQTGLQVTVTLDPQWAEHLDELFKSREEGVLYILKCYYKRRALMDAEMKARAEAENEAYRAMKQDTALWLKIKAEGEQQ